MNIGFLCDSLSRYRMVFKYLWIYTLLLLHLFHNSYAQGKGCADISPSCCNGISNACKPPHTNCYCDEACEKYNNCCPDYASLCKKGCADISPSCCNGISNACKPPHTNCYCDEACEKYNNCCPDYASLCKKVPINGCLSSPCSPNANCITTSATGTYNCTCKSGFTGSGTVCNDVNECDLNICSSNDTCQNTIGSYNCYRNPGFSASTATVLPHASATTTYRSGMWITLALLMMVLCYMPHCILF